MRPLLAHVVRTCDRTVTLQEAGCRSIDRRREAAISMKLACIKGGSAAVPFVHGTPAKDCARCKAVERIPSYD